MKNIRYLFYPRRIAVIGASRNKRKVGRVIFDNLLKSKVEVVPINPKADKISGKKAYKSIKDVGNVDLCIIAVRNTIVPKVLEECGENGVKASIIISAGFGEVGNYDLEKEIIKISKKFKIATVGPNCMGIIFPEKNMNATFAPGNFKDGDFVVISQSGALGAGLLDYFLKENIGFRSFISIGNQAVLTVEDFVEFFSKDKKTKAIGIYIEGVKDGQKFIKTLKKSEKKIFILKSGRTKIGELAARSHTGAIVTDDKIYTFAIKQAKKVRVSNLEEFLYSLLIKEIPGKRVIIITNSGGPAVLLSDYLSENGFEIIKLPKDLIEDLNKVLPASWSHGNPIDVLGDATSERYSKVLEILKNYKSLFDIAIFVLTPLQMTDIDRISNLIIKFKEETRKFVVTNFIGGKKIEKYVRKMKKRGIINFFNGETLAKVLKYVMTPKTADR